MKKTVIPPFTAEDALALTQRVEQEQDAATAAWDAWEHAERAWEDARSGGASEAELQQLKQKASRLCLLWEKAVGLR